MRHVILGHGAAGIAAARKLRELRPNDEIAIVSDEPYLPYSRCLLAEYIGGARSQDWLFVYPPGFFQEERLELLLGRRAVELDVEGQALALEGGERLGYDRLLLATGALPDAGPLRGDQSERVVHLRTLADAERIIDLASQARRCVVLGGGYIGLEVAYALRRRGLEVVLIEMMPHILYTSLDEVAAQIITDDLRKEGVAIRTGREDEVRQIKGRGQGVWLALHSGEQIEADFAVSALGVRANLALVRTTRIRTDAGVLVDDYLQTNVEGIYAAGDVAQARDLLTGQPRTTPIWPNAVAQGKLAACNMAGLRRGYGGEVGLQNALEFREVPATAFGLSKATEAEGYRVRTAYHPARGVYRKVVLEGDVPRGMIFVGDISNAGVVANLIKSGAYLGPLADRLVEEGFSMAYLVQSPALTATNAAEVQGTRLGSVAQVELMEDGHGFGEGLPRGAVGPRGNAAIYRVPALRR
jgi:NAD(P)H-nitrite reductase large subunit